MLTTKKQRDKRDNIKNLRDTNRILMRKLRETIKYFSQRVQNLERERDKYKRQAEELAEKLKSYSEIS